MPNLDAQRATVGRGRMSAPAGSGGRARQPGAMTRIMRLDSTLLAALGLATLCATAHAASWPNAGPASAAPIAGTVAALAGPARTGHAAGAGSPEQGTSAAAVTPPRDLSDLPGWLEYKTRSHSASLPLEARIFYRRGLFARESGMLDEGVRWVRGAAELDPSYVAPHLTLAGWLLFREPGQALYHYAAVLELARENFLLQLSMAANAIYVGYEALFIALLAAGLLVVVLRVDELRHPWRERLARFLSPASAGWWAWAIVVLPYFVGLGPALPTVAFLGFLWPSLRVRERALFVTLILALAGAPWVVSALDRMAAPIDDRRAPLYGVPLVEAEPWSRERQDRLAALVAEHPDNPFLRFGLAWTARRSGDLASAEVSYRRSLELWPNDDRVLNNLGNVVAMGGRQAVALELYQRAVAANPANAAAHFNASQIYTLRFEYRAATEALSRASALDFDLVKTYQSQGTEDGLLPLVDQWIAPRTCWLALSRESGARSGGLSLPPAWRSRREAAGWPFSVAAVALALLGLALGVREHRGMPLRACSNCERIVCRRCAKRRRELALCPECATIEARAENPDFARVLLLQHQRQLLRRRDLVRTAVATIIPGFGLLAFRRVITPVLLLALTAMVASRWLGGPLPYAFEPRLALAGPPLPVALTLGIALLVYAVSLFTYVDQVARARARAASLAAPVRSRSVQATRRMPAAA